jgi:hypothetical protein
MGWLLIKYERQTQLREKYNRAFEGELQYFENELGDKDGANISQVTNFT